MRGGICPENHTTEVIHMSSIKCKNCGLSNFANATVCVRCDHFLTQSSNAKISKDPPRISFVALLAFTIVGVILYYAWGGFQESMEQVNSNDANRIAIQSQDKYAGLPRTEYDRQRAGGSGTAVQNSNSLGD